MKGVVMGVSYDITDDGEDFIQIPIMVKLTPEEVEKEELRPEWVIELFWEGRVKNDWVLTSVAHSLATYDIEEAMRLVCGARRIRNLRTGDVLPAAIFGGIDNAPPIL